jgi:hypothetical protein
MGFLPIVEKYTARQDKGRRNLASDPLPLFYMQDFSVMGLVVGDRSQALDILAANQIVLKRRAGGWGVEIDSRQPLNRVVGTLVQRGVACEVTDLTDGIYQG